MKPTPISRIQQFLSLSPTAPVRLYSFQGQDAWDIAQERGYWTGSPVPCLGEEEQFVQAYEWMRQQMVKQVPDFSGDLPIWAWTKRPSSKPGKTKRFFSDQPQIRLTIVVPRSRIVLSDYDLWHCVLNKWYLGYTEEECDVHDALSLSKEERQIALEESWTRCLAFNATTDPAVLRWHGSSKYFQVQACVDRIHWHEVVSVRRF